MQTSELTVLTLNLHKGFSALNRQFVLSQLRDALRSANPDVVLLQEVVGEDVHHAESVEDWPIESQYEYLADSVWSEYAYAKNAVYLGGHHGNAILSRYPVIDSHHEIISAHILEQRGFLHSRIQISDEQYLNVLCVHLGLFERWRRAQVQRLGRYIQQRIPVSEPLIVAGDFNDWSVRGHREIHSFLGLKEAHFELHRRVAKTYPAKLPVLSLDRIYYRGVHPTKVWRGERSRWANLSDHLPLLARFSGI